MKGDHLSPLHKDYSSSRTGIPRPALATHNQASSTVQAARSLKRRSVELLNKSSSSITPAKKPAFSSPITPRYPISKPLPDSMRTGRLTMGVTSPRYLQATASTSRRIGSTTTSGPSTPLRLPTTPNASRVNAEIMELRAKISELEAELVKSNSELELTKTQISMKDQSLLMVQQSIAIKDTQLNTIQMALATEKSKSEMMQASVDAKDHEIARLSTELSERMEDIGRLVSQLAAKRDELRERDEEMRLLHNAVVDLRGQIRVAVRVRPPLGKELDVPVNHINYPGVSSIRLDQGKSSQTFEFQRVFGPTMSQARVFNDVEELILSCLHGYNVSIIAYGQTGSGKTHTMRGGEGEAEGIIPRAVKFLFHSRDKLADLDWKFEFKSSFLEVYNEEVYDLLADRKKLDIKMGTGSTSVSGLKYYDINNLDEIERILAVADKTRSTAATKCNEQSSRSHAVFELAIQGFNKTSGASRYASLHLVDLAGSERVKESGAEGDRFKEMTHINSALSNLQNCIRSQLHKNQHIPYRNSKLTMLLRESLGAGNSKTMVIVALNPAITQIAETKRSLEFAQQMSITKIGFAKKQEQ